MEIKKNLKSSLAAIVREEEGLSTVEYIIILVLIAVLSIGLWRAFGTSVRSNITSSTTAVDGLSGS